ncbi:MAG: hypothetical protein B6D58_08800 [candidate division Zixibacteria bacterium 4484_95]|nr:MAG: hypothetical protein B6D58_08800 [candidate division Zixibacteria bacterium 4484_95]
MSPQITELQKRKIKEMVDEIIVGRGMLAIADRQTDVDGMNIDQLSRLAFKYYKMIYLGKNPLDIDVSGNRIHYTRNHHSERKKGRFCIGCDQLLTNDDIKKGMPVCSLCRTKLKADYEMLKKILDL